MASPRCSSTIGAALWRTSRPELIMLMSISSRAAIPWIRCSQLQVYHISSLIGLWETLPKTLVAPLPAAARGDGRWFTMAILADPRRLAQLYKMSLVNLLIILGRRPADCALLLQVPVPCLPCCPLYYRPMNWRRPDASFGLHHVYRQHAARLHSRFHRHWF